ncbi:MAG TPA: hypothetical protein VMV66_01650 [Candidatus Humimicrobiaceae bacterium]|nr:hypothetical protein [Candidatus Humimicrobiaceae bacterium]
MASLFVINARGEKEPFSFQKVYRSAKRAGAFSKIARKIAETIEKEAYPGMKTLEIFGRIKKMLGREAPGVALKFNIKEGMRKLGPTGFPFEKYVGEILKNLGYEVKINRFLPAKCVRSYEIDFVAEKGKTIYVGECKYRQDFGDIINSQDALANYARFLDISRGNYFKSPKYKNREIKTMLVTNTKFSGKSIAYCRCVGVELLGWNYPENRGLEYLIGREKLYPVTILPALKKYIKKAFVEEKTILAKDVLEIDPEKFARKHKIQLRQLQSLISQAKILLT